MLSSFLMAAAAASLSFVGDFLSVLAGVAVTASFGLSSGLALLGLPTKVTELIAPGDDGDVPSKFKFSIRLFRSIFHEILLFL